jgi:hypothetical protein
VSQEQIIKLEQLVKNKIDSTERNLPKVEELYNLDCAENFIEMMLHKKVDLNSKEQLLFHLREANAPSEWIELAQNIRVGGGQLNIFETTWEATLESKSA